MHKQCKMHGVSVGFSYNAPKGFVYRVEGCVECCYDGIDSVIFTGSMIMYSVQLRYNMNFY
jgi:hypothetical protein